MVALGHSHSFCSFLSCSLINSVFPGQLRAVIGTDRWRYTLLQRNIQMLNVDKIEKHPKWNSRRAQNDIALVRLSKPIEFNARASPICLPPYEEFDVSPGEQLTLAGYGYTTDRIAFNRLPTQLQSVTIPVMQMDQCQQMYNRTRIPITERMICAGSALDGECKGALKGDSGSPLITYLNGQAIHTGIVSFSLPCRFTGAPDVFTRTASYLEWIKQVSSRL